ncbi:MAG: response regulator transcription factor [Chloroflexi bacterium]|nr:response regulator transcription factor [Chloroflexota bacterium]
MKVLIVEDERDVCEAIALSLRFQWPEVQIVVAEDGMEGVKAGHLPDVDLVLLDIMLPGLDGFSVLREIRRTSAVPVVVLTARGDELDKVRGLELGADDYVTKPFSHLELLARVKAVLRRAEAPLVGLDQLRRYADDYLTIDFAAHEVRVRGQPVYFTPTEFNLLWQLAKNAGHIVPHRILLARVWGEEYESEADYLRVYVRRLREKIEPDPNTPRYILTERGLGYRFRRGE